MLSRPLSNPNFLFQPDPILSGLNSIQSKSNNVLFKAGEKISFISSEDQ